MKTVTIMKKENKGNKREEKSCRMTHAKNIAIRKPIRI
jgi:hypothetical protein